LGGELTTLRLLGQWQKAYEELKKRFPTPMPASTPDNRRKGSSGDGGPRSELDKKEQGLLYRGKPVSFWTSQSNDADPKFRAEAVKALGFFAQKDKQVIPLLVAYLKDTDSTVGRAVAQALYPLGTDVVPALKEVLKDGTVEATRNAAYALYLMGPKGKA